MEQVLVEPTYAPTDVRPTAGGLDGLLLLLLATGGPCDLRGLLDAAGAMAAQRLDESALDLLVRTGLAVSRRGRLTLPSDQTARELLEQTPPSAVAAAHAAWAEVLVDDWGERARHEALAVIGPNDCAAQRAASTALRLQRAGRQESATEMFELAARISAPGAARVELLMRGAACAYAAGQLERGHQLAAAASRLQVVEPSPASCVLEATFRGSEEETGTPWVDHVTAATLLCAWGQFAAAFAVLATSAVRRWDTGQLAAAGEAEGRPRQPAEDAITALAHLRAGNMSTALPLLRAAADDMDALGEYGAATAAYAIVGEVAACLGHVWAATRALRRAGQLAEVTGQLRWLARVELAEALLAARRGSEGPRVLATTRHALLSARPLERDRAELVQAVGLVSCEQWPEAYDILVGMVERPCGPRPELVAWGLLSHFADAALHSGHAGEGRRLVSRLGDVDGLFEYDATLAELMYATAVLSETRHADACFEVLLSHDPHRWPWLRARAHLAYGEHLRRERQVTAARRQLVTARRLFEAMGATSLERRAANELRAGGVRERSVGPTPPVDALLSPQELQIAQMAADGLTNRQIGQVLYLSPRTVGSHLYRIFPKLQIASRNQLPSILAR